MSLNIEIDGYLNDGVGRISFWVIQTPTDVTFDILESKDPLEAYFDYVRKSVVDSKFVEDHIEGLKKDIDKAKQAGYNIVVSYM